MTGRSYYKRRYLTLLALGILILNTRCNFKSDHNKPTNNLPKSSTTEDSVVALVARLPVVKNEMNLIDSLSSGKRHVKFIASLNDTTNNIYEVKVCEDNGDALVTYYHINVDANKMIVLNPTGEMDEE
ncbi:MAG: hypothetical protein JST70_08925 [Bacteroidetes bacterium]|nr:hypothetical protein [Bacteroidota bacterium]